MSRCAVYDVQYSTQLDLVSFVVQHFCTVVHLILTRFLRDFLIV